MATRREFLTRLVGGAAVTALLPGCAVTAIEHGQTPPDTLGLPLTPEQVADGLAFLRLHPSVDIHAHPGLFFLAGVTDPTPTMAALGTPFVDRSAADLHAGRVSAVLFAGVADARLIEMSPTGLRSTRDYAPGEVWADYQRQLYALKALVAAGRFVEGDSPADITRAHRYGQTACVFSIEGGDFFEDRLERVAQAYTDGIRAVTIVHYHVNQIGDIQTAPAYHGGITPLGAQIVREMNRVGIIVDLAHAPESVIRGAVDVATRPMMISHSNLTTPTLQHPRLITLEQARLVTSRGGIVGSVPSGIGQSTFGQWVDSILRLIDGVGLDHVAIGTDMDANFAPVFTSFRHWPLIPAALLARGLAEADVAKVLGGNFLRLYADNRP